MKLNKYFDTDEFKCKCGKCVSKDIDPNLIPILTDVREHFKSPVIVTSGYRCEEHNKKIGGAKNSYHVKASAVDFVVFGKKVNEVYNYLDDKYPLQYGLINEKTWVHLDTRMIKYREIK